MEPCTLCGSNVFTYLGTLGRFVWLRCRACGADISVPAENYDQCGEGVGDQ